MARTAQEETFVGSGGLEIFLRSWRPDGTPRAVVVICHGVNSHGGQYAWTGEQRATPGPKEKKHSRTQKHDGLLIGRRQSADKCRPG